MQTGFDFSQALLWIVILPLLGAIANGLFGRFASRKLVGAVGVGSVAIAFVISLLAFLQIATGEGESRLVHDVYEWFSITIGRSEVPIRVRFVLDSLSGVMALIVSGIGLLIHIYSLGYMEEDPGFARFFAYLNLFMASMLILVLASNLPLMFVGWEGVGLCSYLLIGFWYENKDFAKAGRKAFVMNRIGDFGVLAGMFILVTAIGSFEFAEINDAAARVGGRPWMLGSVELGTIAGAACLFLFLGCTGKSAQIPLYTWLPDAMAGPTPVSALIHAATMVTSGVYLCCRLSPLFLETPTVMAIIAVVGALTALLSASIALVQNHMKKILAYSTVSQLGFMFAAVGSGAFAAGIMHVYTHAFFKACLFLGAGSVMHAVGEHADADIRKLGGMKRFMPQTHWTFLLSCLAIAGVPLFSGFFSKDWILLGAAQVAGTDYYGTPALGWFVFVVLVVAAIMTAFYMFRLYFRVFSGEYRSAGEGEAAHAAHGHDDHDHPYDPHPHESPVTMTGPLAVLGIGALVAGYVHLKPLFVPFDAWGGWLEGTVVGLGAAVMDLEMLEHAEHTAHLAASAGGLLAMAVGVGVAFSMYRGKAEDPMEQVLPRGLHRLLMDKWRVNELYDAVIVGPIAWLAKVCGWVDKTFVDGLLTRATSLAVKAGGFVVTRPQNGVIFAYGTVLVVGFAGALYWVLYPQIDVESEVEGSRVSYAVMPGLGYEYRWDGDADGEWDTEFRAGQRILTRAYRAEEWKGYVLFVQGDRPGAEETLELEPGRAVSIPTSLLGNPRVWRARAEANPNGPVAILGPRGRVTVRPNAASMRTQGKPVDEEAVLAPGEGARFDGGAVIQVGARVEARLQVRNSFGNSKTKTISAAIHPAPGEGPAVAASSSPEAAMATAEVSR
jgi:NADH-quinone oxidoreductase subunit L